ncbi:MAG: C-GCAxxG-C-C family (seleno)protein [Enterocloster bolteae]
MTRDRIYEYFIEKDNNCAEAMLRALNDEYCLGIPDDSVKLVGGFGGGMGCGKACGALCGGCSAISYRLIHERAHATRSLNGCGRICGGICGAFWFGCLL